MTNTSSSRLIFALFAAGLVAGCATKPPPPPPPPPAPVKKVVPPYTWNETDAKGPKRIVVDVSAQRVYFYRGETCVGDSRCSTGKKGFETARGQFQVTQKNRDHKSNLYGTFVGAGGKVVKRDVDMSKMKVPEGCSFNGAKMPFYLRFTGGYGLHAGRVPNYPASHGCVRLPHGMAARLFDNVELGTPVIVRQ